VWSWAEAMRRLGTEGAIVAIFGLCVDAPALIARERRITSSRLGVFARLSPIPLNNDYGSLALGDWVEHQKINKLT
jgi:hypothetical protein